MFLSPEIGYDTIRQVHLAQRIYGDLESKFEVVECHKRFEDQEDPSKPDLSRPGIQALGVKAVDTAGEEILRKTIEALGWNVEEVNDTQGVLEWAERPYQTQQTQLQS